MLDVVLTGGTIADGTGGPVYVTDVAIAADRIVRVGDCAGLDAAWRLDCAGLVIAPGFIDIHGHSDELLLADPLAPSKLRQGITTEIGGNCGTSPGPLSPPEFEERREQSRRLYGIDVDWRDLDGFFNRLERSGAALNFACLAGLGETRNVVAGYTSRPLDAAELARECELVAEACRQGAIGVSSGLVYPPSRFANRDELIALARSAVRSGGALYATHLRNEGDALVEAVDEALDIGMRAECAVELSHHKAAGKRNWGKVHDTLAHVERARSRGLAVQLDQYPYKASSTDLAVILPEDVNVGSRDQVLARLADPAYGALVAARVDLARSGSWNDILISTVSTSRNKAAEGMTIAQLAGATGQTPAAAALRLLVEERLEVSAIFFDMCEPDVQAVLSYQYTSIGTDASARAPLGPTSAGVPHPRAYGAFPRIFKRYVRDIPLLTLPEAVRRATGLPAAQLGLRQRGKIAENWYADIVVFELERIADTATYEQPHQYPEGIRHVFVNGRVAVRDEQMTGAVAGKVLRRGRDL